jgi:hypothetical protein
MRGRLGNCTIGKRRGNEIPVKRLYARQTLSLEWGRDGSGFTGCDAGNASGTVRRGRPQATASQPHGRRRMTPSRSHVGFERE